ncbi:MAG TPA: cytochrome c [Burkholderiales bacterium]|nr:cytochrome c [Burkholderiales bacterium]
MPDRWWPGAAFIVLCTFAAHAYAQGGSAPARSLAATCFTCHGTDGRSVGGVPPSLAGRDRNELVQQMKDFKAGRRPGTIMQQHAKGYTDAQIEQIAAYFAAVPSAQPGR